MSESTVPDTDVFVRYLERTRWFGVKGRAFQIAGARRVGDVPGQAEGGPRVVIELVDVAYGDAEGGIGDGLGCECVNWLVESDGNKLGDHLPPAIFVTAT